jgi:hypothetical protein
VGSAAPEELASVERGLFLRLDARRLTVAKFETVPIGELKHRLPAKLLPLVEEYRDKLEKLTTEQGGRLTLEKGDGPHQGPSWISCA